MIADTGESSLWAWPRYVACTLKARSSLAADNADEVLHSHRLFYFLRAKIKIQARGKRLPAEYQPFT